ncbi:hypothetical protein WKW79_23025 [Variovorax robiniae]|uniref:Uncharacterized protein n=1 Tax=Variovorax robiniae TaxID=1836199 RepID=A0ABU8XC95_9BURK
MTSRTLGDRSPMAMLPREVRMMHGEFTPGMFRCGGIALLLGSMLVQVAAAQGGQDAAGLEAAFASAFSLVPEVARLYAPTACRKHGLQAAEVARARDSGLGKASALALLRPSQHPGADADDLRVDAALVLAYSAIVDFAFGPARPTPELAGTMVNGACLLGAGRLVGARSI